MKLNTFFIAIIGTVIFTIIMMRSCLGPPVDNKPKIVTVTKIDTVFTHIIQEKPVYIPGPTKTMYVNVPTKVDTTEVLKDYFAKRYYKDKIKLDSLDGYAIVEDTISQNLILNRKVSFDYKIPKITKTVTNTITLPPKRQLYFGLEMNGNQIQLINYFGGVITLKDKKDQLYNIGLGINNNGIPTFKIGTSWKIKIK